MHLAKTLARPAFTLVELLVVVAILIVLAMLATVTISSTFNYVTEVRARNEIEQLADACEAFKLQYGRYPPSHVHLREKGNYEEPAVGGGPVREYLASKAELEAIFRGIDLDLYARSGGQAWHDWNGNGVADDGYWLDGEQCLVFFLGGLFERDPQTGAYHLTGFCPDKTRPAVRTPGKPRSGPFFEFDSRRLVSLEKWGRGREPANQKSLAFPVYLDPWGVPYAYFRAGPPNDPPIYRNTSHLYLFVMNHAVNDDPAGMLFTPYWREPGPPGQDRIWHMPSKFQIISAGKDKKFGGGGRWPFRASDPVGITTPYDHDNLTNFAERRLGVGH